MSGIRSHLDVHLIFIYTEKLKEPMKIPVNITEWQI